MDSRGTTLLADLQIGLLGSPTAMVIAIGCPDNGGLAGTGYLIADSLWHMAYSLWLDSEGEINPTSIANH